MGKYTYRGSRAIARGIMAYPHPIRSMGLTYNGRSVTEDIMIVIRACIPDKIKPQSVMYLYIPQSVEINLNQL